MRIASESEKVFASFSGVQVSQKQAFFRWTIQIIMTLTPFVYFDTENHFILSQKSVLDGNSQKKVSLMVIVNIKVYNHMHFICDRVICV